MKHIGILAPIFTLPNQYGIGDFSDAAYEFIDFLNKINYSHWQILPLNPTDKYGCPYATLSSFAFDDIYVSLPDLKRRGLIKRVIPFSLIVRRINYRLVRNYKRLYLLEAYRNFKKNDDAQIILNQFIKENPKINEYAHFVVLRKLNRNKKWSNWKQLNLSDEQHVNQVNFEIFKQYILFNQWKELHQYANEHGVTIIGDLPFYVGYDSADVYFHKEAFLLDKKFNPTLVAGVPPDYYSRDGQLWGNPVYNWPYLMKHKYDLLCDRINFANKIFDVIRLDHFRAFDTYYTVSPRAKTARNGKWMEAPGIAFFDYLFRQLPSIKLVAEDLGYLRDEVYALRNHYNLPGMQVLQFTLIEEEINHHYFQHVNKRENSILYLSTHDSFTALSWIDSLKKKERHFLLSFLKAKYHYDDEILNLFNYAVNEPADLVILMISDILHLKKEGRINIPGEKSIRNWTFRFKTFKLLYPYQNELRALALRSGRK